MHKIKWFIGVECLERLIVGGMSCLVRTSLDKSMLLAFELEQQMNEADLYSFETRLVDTMNNELIVLLILDMIYLSYCPIVMFSIGVTNQQSKGIYCEYML